jgi:hypothetical protein
MSQDKQEPISAKRVLYSMPGMESVTVRRDQPYQGADGGDLTFDLYSQPDAAAGVGRPAVVFVTGYSDAGAQKFLGCRFKEMGSYVSWAQLVAASGLVAVTYANRDPAGDVHAVLQHVRQNAAALGIDEKRIGVWSCSGNVPNALAVLMSGAREHLSCAVLNYAYTLDLDGSTRVADGARQFGFVTPAAGKRVQDLPHNVPLFMVRCGRDEMPGLNEAFDRFASSALTANLPVAFVNHAESPHAFDLFHDSETTREIVRQVLGFLRFHLLGQSR